MKRVHIPNAPDPTGSENPQSEYVKKFMASTGSATKKGYNWIPKENPHPEKPRTPAGGRENPQSKSVKKFMAYNWRL